MTREGRTDTPPHPVSPSAPQPKAPSFGPPHVCRRLRPRPVLWFHSLPHLHPRPPKDLRLDSHPSPGSTPVIHLSVTRDDSERAGGPLGGGVGTWVAAVRPGGFGSGVGGEATEGWRPCVPRHPSSADLPRRPRRNDRPRPGTRWSSGTSRGSVGERAIRQPRIDAEGSSVPGQRKLRGSGRPPPYSWVAASVWASASSSGVHVPRGWDSNPARPFGLRTQNRRRPRSWYVCVLQHPSRFRVVLRRPRVDGTREKGGFLPSSSTAPGHPSPR